MMRLTDVALLLTLSLASSQVAHGQVLKDPATFRCKLWTEMRADKPDSLNPLTSSVVSWLQGYFAGAEGLASAFFLRTDTAVQADLKKGVTATVFILEADGMPKWIDGYCQMHPADLLGMAAIRLLRDAYTNPLRK